MAKGGLTKGKSHAEGGIKMKVKSTGQNIEVEGGEVIINKKNVADPTRLNFEGEQKTTCEILSDLNSRNDNGVTLECDSVEGKKYKHKEGGKLKDDEMLKRLTKNKEDRYIYFMKSKNKSEREYRGEALKEAEVNLAKYKAMLKNQNKEQTPKSYLEKALKGIEVAIEISGETKDLLKAKEGIKMAMGLSKPSLTKRQKLEQDLKNESVKIWFEKKDNITRQTNKKFLSISELTDVELNRLRNDIIIYGIKKGILSDKKGRTVFLNWELTTKKPKYKIYYLTENGAEKTLFFDNKKDALKEVMLLNKVDYLNDYTLLNISEWNKDYEDYINFKTPHTINRM